ncbi:hypothetical protein [Mycolicibacterium thermoresistibile]
MTTGVAVVGAGIIATPSIMAAPPADVSVRADSDRAYAINLAADVEALQLQEQFEALLAGTDLIDRVQEAVEYIIRTGLGSGFQSHDPATDPIDGAFRLAEGFGASAVRTLYGAALVPLGVIAVVQALADGDDPGAAFAEFITQTIDGPSWAVNPILFALRDALLEPLGGSDGVFAGLQDQFQLISKQIGNTIVSLLGLHPVSTMAATGVSSGFLGAVDPFSRAQEAIEYIVRSGFGSGFEDHVAADGIVDGFFRLGEGFGASAVRTASSAALLPLGLVDVVGSVVDGEQDPAVALAHFITQTVHGPSWAVNPVLFALRDALVEPLGGPEGVFADVQNQLQLASKEAGAAIVSLLGLDAPEASSTSSRQPDALNSMPEAQHTPSQAGVMRLAQNGPTAVPGQGETLDVTNGSGTDVGGGQRGTDAAGDRKSNEATPNAERQPKLVDVPTRHQQKRGEQQVERQQQRAEQRAERHQKREERAERQQQRQSKVTSQKSTSSENAE